MPPFKIGKFEREDWEKDSNCVNFDIMIDTSFPVQTNILIVQRNIHAETPRRFFVKGFGELKDAQKAHSLIVELLNSLYKAGYRIRFDPDEDSEHNPIGF